MGFLCWQVRVLCGQGSKVDSRWGRGGGGEWGRVAGCSAFCFCVTSFFITPAFLSLWKNIIFQHSFLLLGSTTFLLLYSSSFLKISIHLSSFLLFPTFSSHSQTRTFHYSLPIIRSEFNDHIVSETMVSFLMIVSSCRWFCIWILSFHHEWRMLTRFCVLFDVPRELLWIS